MARRFSIKNKRGAAKKFSKATSRTKMANVRNPMRGGIRL